MQVRLTATDTSGKQIAQWNAEHDDWQARAEAAEAALGAARAELAQARDDARVLAGIANHTALWDLPDAEEPALDAAVHHADTLSDADIIAVIRRALGLPEAS